jgi:inorganic pyrophosphatase
MKIVTSGSNYIDIDAYAGCVAYAELLRAQGIDAKAVSMATPNASIPRDYIKHDDIELTTTYKLAADDTFILIDITNPEYFDKIVDEKRIEAIYDHHYGFEELWQGKIGDAAHIEFIGAACTLIYEQWQAAGMIQQMKPHTAKMLAAGILDNTLNLKAVITAERDKVAYMTLCEIGKLQDTFAEEYFRSCEQQMAENLEEALENDRKDHRFPHVDFDITILQMAVWDAKSFIEKYEGDMEEYGNSTGNEWFVNILSVGDGASYFLVGSEKAKELLSSLFELDFAENVGKAPRLWLRKEMFKHTGGSGALG